MIKLRPQRYSHDVWHISGTDHSFSHSKLDLYLWFLEWGRAKALAEIRKQVVGGLSGYLETGQAENRAGGAPVCVCVCGESLCSPCSSSVTPASFPIGLLSRAAWAALSTDKWPPYALLPFYLLLFLQLRDPGEQAASCGCAPTTPPPTVMTAKRRVARRTPGLHPMPSRPGASPSAVTYRAQPT